MIPNNETLNPDCQQGRQVLLVEGSSSVSIAASATPSMFFAAFDYSK